MSDYIDEVFGATGALAKRFPGYEPREGQVSLARAVDAAIKNDGHLLAEAPTGTGKSLAYAVPAIYHALQRRENAVPGAAAIIVTANIALQEQLVRKDLPLLSEILTWPFDYALLKGKNNFLCVDRLINGAPGAPDAADAEAIEKIVEWANHTETGDVSELPFEPPYSAWSRFSVGSDDCVGSECDYYKSCFSELARKHAQRAHVVVTNYHLFFADMKIRQVTGGMVSILPPYSIAVLDEGHKATDIARDFFGFRITEGSLGWAGAMLPWEERAGLENAAQAFFMSLRSHKNSGMYKARLRKADAVDSSFIVAALRKARVAYGDMIEPLFGEDATTEQRKEAIKIARKLGRIVEIEKQIELAMRLRSSPKQPWQPVPSSPDDTSGVRWYWSDPGLGGNNTVKSEADASSIDDVFYIEEDRSKTVLCSRPIRVAERLREELFKTTQSVSVTSATLMARGSFDFIASDLGVDKPATLEAKSPFNWREAALLVTPPDVPEPNAAEFTRAAAQKCRETIEYAKGRTLALFTSYKNLNAAHEAVLHTGYRILRQGDMPRTQLIDEFRKDTNSVLLGVESFWAGVDVPGESLSCVFIDRLPFITPEDPVMDALSESDREWFMKYSVPRAIIAFKQGFGRLIRTVNDRGVVVLLDRRISTKFYGKFFINSLPSVQRSYNLEDVRRFLDKEELVFTATDRAPDSKSLFG
jgi:ATP-dependent DNA helicase DinG